MGSYIVGGIVLVIVIMVIIYLVKSKKNGKSSCGGNCMSCPMGDGCHGHKKK